MVVVMVVVVVVVHACFEAMRPTNQPRLSL
jgi:hypothetical protein